MRLFYATLLMITSFQVVTAQDIKGSWELETTKDGVAQTELLSFSGPYFSWTVYGKEDGAFVSTKGGSWKKDGNQLVLMYEFHTADTNQVGTTQQFNTKLKADFIKLKGNGAPKGKWMDVDQGQTTPLTGSWLISGRKRNGEIRRNNIDRPRKTMKILTGTRFQWIAYDVEKKAFYGTGGGTYTAENGVYTENIKFFSRDNSRVGASLKFEFAVEDGDWIHSGKSSKGDPLYEIWSTREK